MGSYTEPGTNVTAYQLSQFYGILWLIPIGVAIVISLLFIAHRIGMQASRLASLICGIVPFIIYASIVGEDIKQPGIGLFVGAIGTLLAIMGVFSTKTEIQQTRNPRPS